jgi:hypothetical protein
MLGAFSSRATLPQMGKLVDRPAAGASLIISGELQISRQRALFL